MCECNIPKSIIDKIMEPSVWFPVVVAIAAYFIQLWIRTVRKRREDSLIAAIYLHEIKMEVDVGIERLEYLYTHAGQPFKSGEYLPVMPTQSWTGVREIFPDDVFRRLNNVARHSGRAMIFDDLRFHLKNYFTVVCKFGNDAITGVGPFDKVTARCDLDGARMVRSKLIEAEKLMNKNANRLFWTW